jgi:SNF2 family DNA or RNA helicase
VIAPLRVCHTVWPVEARKWDDFHELRVVNLCGMKPAERKAALESDAHVYCINPEMVVKLLPELGKDFDLLVVDESTKFKDTQTQRFKALRPVIPRFKRRMILTGTPIPNGVMDLFGQMFIVDLGASLGRYITHFRMEFCHEDPSGYGYQLNRGADQMIYKRVANRLLRMDAKDHLAMPELVYNVIPVELPQKHRKQYDALEAGYVAQVNDTSVAVYNAAALGTKLRQMANGFIYDDQNGMIERRTIDLHDEKLEALEELYEEMNGRPLLVAYEFIEDARKILDRFPMAVDLGKSKRPDQDFARFNRGEIQLAIAHPASLGHGVNLQDACSTVCWYGITWNLEHYIQFNARVWRQGQQAPVVVVHHIACRDTKDEDVAQALAQKDRTQKSFNDSIKKGRK